MAQSPATHGERMDPLSIASDADDTATSLIIPSAPEASAVPRPSNIGTLWVEDEYNALEREQKPLWDASGEDAAREPRATAASEELSATAAEWLLKAHERVVDATLQRYLDTVAALSAYRRRAVGSKRWYLLGKVGLFLGDLAGFASAAIWLGEEIPLAASLAMSAATATIAAGLIGTEIRDIRTRKARAHALSEEVPETLDSFRHLFAVADDGERHIWQVVKVSLLTAGMIGVGIGTLRAAVDDPLVGLVFGAIALAVAGGSFLISYAGADQIADLIDHTRADYVRAESEHRRMAGDPSWRVRAKARADEASVRAEHGHRGRAAQDHVQALKHRVLRSNPQVAGHGPGTQAAGRAVRREEGQR